MRLGINLAGLTDWNTEHPFVDVFRLSRAWISQRDGAAWGKGPELDKDTSGWIRRLEPGCWAETPILTHGGAASGEYVCLYEGEGELEFRHNGKLVSQSPGRMVVQIDGLKGGVFIALRRTNPTNYIRNIRVLMPGLEKQAKTNLFAPEFLNRWRGIETVRFMDWQETNGSKQRGWKDRPLMTDATWTLHGAPVEVMVDLCNTLKVNPWFCMPHLATDDYVRQFAGVVKARLDPTLKPHIEHSNEVWNGMFAQHQHAVSRSKELGLGPKDRPWEGAGLYHARRSVELFRIWSDVWGGNERLRRIVSWQAAGGEYWTDNIILAGNDTAKSCDALAIAPYISFIATPNSKPSSDAVARWSIDQILDYAETNAMPESIGWMRAQKKVADKYGLELMSYEAGQHLVGAGGGENNDDLTKLFIAANRHPRMGELYSRYLKAWSETGGGLCCLFSSVSSPSKWGSWGLLEHAQQSADASPKFKALRAWQQSTK